MRTCDNPECRVKYNERQYDVRIGDRRFCCTDCAVEWIKLNDRIIEAASPFHRPFKPPRAIRD